MIFQLHLTRRKKWSGMMDRYSIVVDELFSADPKNSAFNGPRGWFALVKTLYEFSVLV